MGNMTLNETHVTIPLRRPIVYASGRQSYLPMRVLNLLRGIALFDINSVTGALEMRAASSSSFWLEGAYHEPARAGLYLSPVAPSIPVAADDGRSFSLAGSFNVALKAVVEVFKGLPADYTRFASDPAAI